MAKKEFALDVTDCVVEPAYPDGLALVEAETGRCVILYGGGSELLKTFAKALDLLGQAVEANAAEDTARARFGDGID